MKIKNYSLHADIVRVVALFSVVGIHLLTPIYARPDFFGGKFWWITFLLNCLFRASVPLFMMLSGYLVLGKETSLKENLERTWKRIGFPLAFFYMIVQGYTFLAAYLREEPFVVESIFHNVSKNTYSYLYFLVVLVFLYLLSPLFKRVFDDKDTQLASYTIIFFFANAALATLARYLSLREGDVLHTYTMWIVWVGYFLYGYFFKQHEQIIATKQKCNLTLLGVGYLSTVLLGYFSLQQHLQGNDIFYIGGQTYPEEYLSVCVIMMSIAIFNVMMTMKLPKQLLSNTFFIRCIQTFAGLSFAVYLVHPLVMDVLNKFCGVAADSPLMPSLPIYVIVNAALTLVVSTVLALLLSYTPLLKKTVGR